MKVNTESANEANKRGVVEWVTYLFGLGANNTLAYLNRCCNEYFKGMRSTLFLSITSQN